jgi:hypothetical protein
MALANSAMAGTADSIAKDLSSATVKEDVMKLEIPKEEFSLAQITDASRILKEFESSKDVPTEMSGPSHPVAEPDTIKVRDASVNFWTKEASDVVARALVSEIIGVVADDDEDEDKNKPSAEDKPAKETAAKEAAKDAPEATDVPAAPAAVKEEETSKKEAGKIKGPGIPDGTGPMSGTSKCPLNPGKEEKEETSKKKAEKIKEEVPAIVPPEPGTKEAVVDTDILASVTFAGIEVPTGIMSMDDVGEMSDQEKANLAQLF